jgi:hypothetical protein
MTDIEKNKIIKSHCNTCIGEKNHNLLFRHLHKWSNEEYDIYGDDVYELLQCCGCDSIILRQRSRFSEDFDENGLIVNTKYYPPAISRRKPLWFRDIISIGHPKFNLIKELIDEVYIAMHSGSNRLAAMGTRAIIETMMIDKVSDNDSFAANLSEMFKQGYISPKQNERLKIVLDAGHAAIHRDYCPTTKELNSILDICENVIESLYIHEVKAKSLSKKIPPRPPRNKNVVEAEVVPEKKL